MVLITPPNSNASLSCTTETKVNSCPLYLVNACTISLMTSGFKHPWRRCFAHCQQLFKDDILALQHFVEFLNESLLVHLLFQNLIK